MRFRNISISKQIGIWLAAIYAVVVVLAISAMASVNMLWNNTATLYEHPLTVRTAIGQMHVDILSIRKNVILYLMEERRESDDALLLEIDEKEADAYRQINILYDYYLGPKTDIDAVYNSIAQWKTIRDETIHLFNTGHRQEALERIDTTGVSGKQADTVMSKLKVISDFASNKASELYNSAYAQRNVNVLLLSLLLVATAIVLSAIGFYLRKGIITP